MVVGGGVNFFCSVPALVVLQRNAAASCVVAPPLDVLHCNACQPEGKKKRDWMLELMVPEVEPHAASTADEPDFPATLAHFGWEGEDSDARSQTCARDSAEALFEILSQVLLSMKECRAHRLLICGQRERQLTSL